MILCLADNGYSSSPVLITPVQNPLENSPEKRFNDAFLPTRSISERTFGTKKGPWRCILGERLLRYHYQFSAKVIYATACLHNFRKVLRFVKQFIKLEK